MRTKQSKTALGTKKTPLFLSVLLLMVNLFIACENPGWIIADIPPMTQPTATQPTTTQPTATQPTATQPTTTMPATPPFVISKPVVEIKERINAFKYSGIVFKFLNNSERYVDKITICFMLFDTKSQTNPFIGSNRFKISKYDFLAPGENKEISISLDNYIYVAPTEPYIIDFFYISEIHYIDNAVWQDPYGIYRVRWEK
jgi:hypothetical protein